MPRLTRPTRDEIDDEILDAAATLFARHGFEQTSVQRIADAVGYSKTGLLHRFPSKETLQEAAVARTLEQVAQVAATVEHLPPGPARDHAAIATITDLALHRPGFVAFVLSSLSAAPGSAVADRLDEIAVAIFNAFAAVPHTDPPRELRIVVALGGLAVAALACRQEEDVAADVRDDVAAAAFDALGHHRTTPQDRSTRNPEEN